MRDLVILCLLVATIAGVIAPGNGASRPLNAHEILVAETATEMQQRGDYLVPYYNGIIRLEKPPLPYWLAIVVHRLAGSSVGPRVTELEARIPSLVAALILLVVTCGLGAVAFADRRVGLVAAAVLATSAHFFVFARSARPEILYALFCTIEMLGVMIAIRSYERGLSTTGGALIAWVATAGAVMSKGPQLPFFFLAGTMIALMLRRPRAPAVAILRPLLGLAVLATVVPYFVYLVTHSQNAVSFWAQQMVQDKPVPLWLRPLRFYYPAMLVVGFCPWVLAVGLTIVDIWKRRHPSALVLASSILVALACLSFAGKLRDHYVLPALPLLAVLAGAALVDVYDRARDATPDGGALRRLGIAQAAVTVVALAIAGAFSLRVNAVTGERTWPAALPLLALGLVLAYAAVRMLPRRPVLAFTSLVAALAAGWTAVSFAGLDVSPRWASAKSFAEQVAQKVAPSDPILLESGIEESLVYYGERRVVWGSARDWLAVHPRGRVRRFVCEGSCAGVAGREIIRQSTVPDESAMRWLRPDRPTRARERDSGSASPDRAASPR